MHVSKYCDKLDLVRFMNRIAFDMKQPPATGKKRDEWLKQLPSLSELIQYTLRCMLHERRSIRCSIFGEVDETVEATGITNLALHFHEQRLPNALLEFESQLITFVPTPTGRERESLQLRKDVIKDPFLSFIFLRNLYDHQKHDKVLTRVDSLLNAGSISENIRNELLMLKLGITLKEAKKAARQGKDDIHFYHVT